MGIYEQIQQDVQAHYGCTIKTCWIAHVKERSGRAVRSDPNRQSTDRRVYDCPEEVLPLIEESMRRFGILD